MVDIVKGVLAGCPNWPFLGARLSSVRWLARLKRKSIDCQTEEFELVDTVSHCLLAVSWLEFFFEVPVHLWLKYDVF